MDNIFNKWREGLTKTRDVAFGKLANFFGATEIDDSSFDDLEELLIQADVGPATTIQLVDRCTEIVDRDGLTRKDQMYNVVKAEMSRLLEQPSDCHHGCWRERLWENYFHSQVGPSLQKDG
jgi:fused signal recognition particle receptor